MYVQPPTELPVPCIEVAIFVLRYVFVPAGLDASASQVARRDWSHLGLGDGKYKVPIEVEPNMLSEKKN